MKIKIGECPKCGAPIYAPTVWMGVTPPPNEYSCLCSSKDDGTQVVFTNQSTNK